MVYASSIYLFIVHDTFSYRQEVLYQKQKRLSTTFFIFFSFFEFYIFHKNNNDIMMIFTIFKEHLYYNFFNMMYLDNIFYRNEKIKEVRK